MNCVIIWDMKAKLGIGVGFSSAVAIVLLVGALPLGFNACQQNYGIANKDMSSDVGTSNQLTGEVSAIPAADATDQNNNGEIDYQEVFRNCMNQSSQRMTQKIVFEEPRKTCEWGKDGNLLPRNQYFQGRIEEVVALNIPANSIVCNLIMNFPTQAQKYKYDDHFLMTYGHAILASSYDFSDKLSKVSGISIYDWSKMAGMFWDESKEGVFCEGKADGLSNCLWPKTDTDGVISMSFDQKVIQKASAANIALKDQFFRFVSIGDNDDMDCEHSRVEFDVTVDYVSQ